MIMEMKRVMVMMGIWRDTHTCESYERKNWKRTGKTPWISISDESAYSLRIWRLLFVFYMVYDNTTRFPTPIIHYTHNIQ